MAASLKSLTPAAAKDLVARLRRVGNGRTLTARVEGAPDGDERIVFTGGTSEASIFRSVSSEARVLAHWEGYCAAYGLGMDHYLNKRVVFPSRSAPGLTRYGIVRAVTTTRATVTYRFKSGRRAAPKSVALADVRLVP